MLVDMGLAFFQPDIIHLKHIIFFDTKNRRELLDFEIKTLTKQCTFINLF